MRGQRGVGPSRTTRPSAPVPRTTAPTPQTELVRGTVASWKRIRLALPKDGPVQAPPVKCQILAEGAESPPPMPQMPPWPSGAMLVREKSPVDAVAGRVLTVQVEPVSSAANSVVPPLALVAPPPIHTFPPLAARMLSRLAPAGSSVDVGCTGAAAQALPFHLSTD